MEHTLHLLWMGSKIGSDGVYAYFLSGHNLFVDEQFAEALIGQAIGGGKVHSTGGAVRHENAAGTLNLE